MSRTIRTAGMAMIFGALVTGAFVWRPWADASAFDPDKPAKRDGFAAGRNEKPNEVAVKPIPFDAKRSMQYLQLLCDIGPRVSGSEGMAKQQEIVVKHFEEHGAKVVKQEFSAKQFSRKDRVNMVNLIASWFPEREKRVMLCSHYDTRPMAHEEPNRQNWGKPFLSANDGTSGVAMFMELAHQMKEFPTEIGIDFVLFDGEEYVFETTGTFGGGDKFFFGSEHFAETYTKTRSTRKYRYEAAVLFDLFAHPGAKFPVEMNSWQAAPELATQFWDIAKKVNAKSFVFERGVEVQDDHLALNRAGIPAIDVIDFEGYRKHWHKLSDLPEQCSGEQIAEVAGATTAWLQLRK